jgi:hypothetical protein
MEKIFKKKGVPEHVTRFIFIFVQALYCPFEKKILGFGPCSRVLNIADKISESKGRAINENWEDDKFFYKSKKRAIESKYLHCIFLWIS